MVYHHRKIDRKLFEKYRRRLSPYCSVASLYFWAVAGGTVGHNSISLIIPCHRVVGTNGSLTGYAGGIDKKVKLLQLEKADMTRFFVPREGTAL